MIAFAVVRIEVVYVEKAIAITDGAVHVIVSFIGGVIDEHSCKNRDLG